MAMGTFFEGQQVVCINVGHVCEARNDYLHMLEKGHVYTVRDVIENASFSLPGFGLRVDSLYLPKCDVTGIEEAWHPVRFRPCATTDIGIFTQMLDRIPERVNA